MALLLVSNGMGTEGRFYIVTVNYSEAGFAVLNVAVKPLDFLPAPYPEGDYHLQVRRADGSIATDQAFALPERGYIHEYVDESDGWSGGLTELPSVYLDFYLPYDEKAKDITLLDDKGTIRNVIDVTPFSTLTAEQKAAIKEEKAQQAQTARAQQTLVPFFLLVLLLMGVYLWHRKRK